MVSGDKDVFAGEVVQRDKIAQVRKLFARRRRDRSETCPAAAVMRTCCHSGWASGVSCEAILMKSRGQQPEFVVVDAEAFAAFVDAAFAQDDRLPAGGQGGTDDGPFFEGDVVGRIQHALQFIAENSHEHWRLQAGWILSTASFARRAGAARCRRRHAARLAALRRRRGRFGRGPRRRARGRRIRDVIPGRLLMA